MPLPLPHIEVKATRVNGSRAIIDADLAALFGVSLSKLYERIGNKLWCLTPTMYCKLTDGHGRGRMDAHARLAFYCSGAIVLAGILEGGTGNDTGVRVAHALRNRRRASTRKKPRKKRDSDVVLARRYEEAKMRLYEGPFGHLLSRC